MDRETWHAVINGVAKSRTRLSDWIELSSRTWMLCGRYHHGSPAGKESACKVAEPVGFLGWKNPWRRSSEPTQVFLPGGFHGQRSLAGYSSWACKESATSEWPSMHTGLKEYMWGGFGHPMRRTDSLQKTLTLGKREGKRRRGGQRMSGLDGIADLMDMFLLSRLVQSESFWPHVLLQARVPCPSLFLPEFTQTHVREKER